MLLFGTGCSPSSLTGFTSLVNIRRQYRSNSNYSFWYRVKLSFFFHYHCRPSMSCYYLKKLKVYEERDKRKKAEEYQIKETRAIK